MVHCKDKMPKIWNKYSQKRNIRASVPIFTFMCLWANYIFTGWVCLFCWRKYVDRSWEYINRSQTHECGNRGWGSAIPRKGIYKRNCCCSVLNFKTLTWPLRGRECRWWSATSSLSSWWGCSCPRGAARQSFRSFPAWTQTCVNGGHDRLNMEVDLKSLFWLHVTWCVQLNSLAETPHLDSMARALLVSKDRRHLFVTPWWTLCCRWQKTKGLQKDVSIFVDEQRPHNTSPNAGGVGDLRGLSQWVQLCTSRNMEPK